MKVDSPRAHPRCFPPCVAIRIPNHFSDQSHTHQSRSRQLMGKLRWGMLLALSALLGGCASPPSPSPSPASSSSSSSSSASTDSRLVRSAAPRGQLFIKPDHNIGAYDQVHFAPIRVSDLSERDGLHPRESSRLAANLDRNLRARAETGGIEVAKKPEPCAITLAFSIKDIEVDRLLSDIEDGSNATFLRSMGAVTLEVDIRDSVSETALMQFTERRRLDGGQITGSGRAALLNSLGKTLGVLLADFADRLQEVIPRTSQQSSVAPECKGLIRQAADTSFEQP